MRKTFFLLLFIFTYQLYSQDYISSDNFKFKFIKAKKAVGGTYYSTIKISRKERESKGIRKVQVRIKMKSLSKKDTDFDPNKFYLVSDNLSAAINPSTTNSVNIRTGINFVFKCKKAEGIQETSSF